MTDKTDKIEMALKPKALPLPRRPSYERTVEDIEKWANSSGLQKPVRQGLCRASSLRNAGTHAAESIDGAGWEMPFAK